MENDLYTNTLASFLKQVLTALFGLLIGFIPQYRSALGASSSFPDEKDDLKKPQHTLHILSSSEDHPSPLPSPRPIPNSYWATPSLLACEYPWTPLNPDKPKLDALLRAGVRTLIDLTESGELVPYNSILGERCALLGIDTSEIEYHRFGIRDRCLPESVNHMYRVLDTLRDNEERGRISAVHCRGGIGRTGMVIGCWLVDSGVAKDGVDALSIIAREWKSVEKCKRYPNSPETGPQFEFVAKFNPSSKIESETPNMAMGLETV